ncbi:hypothetical protein ACFWBS_54540 [Streptomyces mirabilis]|uniref:hypothetical protein n=1 Tax=Streptomyces mirabilis TaxID=68239 RepID=UPI00365DC871
MTTAMQDLIDSAPPAHPVAKDMADLAELIRTLRDVESMQDTRIRLGGNLFDVVITGGGAEGRAVATMMDEVQGGCGPVIAGPEGGWLYWLVPPGSSSEWERHTHAVCIGAPHTITLPALKHSEPPGPYWLRPSASDRLVPTRALRGFLAQFRPEPTPHASLAAYLRFNTP